MCCRLCNSDSFSPERLILRDYLVKTLITVLVVLAFFDLDGRGSGSRRSLRGDGYRLSYGHHLLCVAAEANLDIMALLVEGERAREDKISVRLILVTFQDADRPSGTFSPDYYAARE